MSRKIMDGRSINKINGETSTVSQMKAAAACLLDIHGQHEHQSLLYQDKQLAILDAYGREKILTGEGKGPGRRIQSIQCHAGTELDSMDMNEEQRNREACVSWSSRSKRLKKPALQTGRGRRAGVHVYRKMNNGKQTDRFSAAGT